MKTCWVLADGFTSPLMAPAHLKDIAPIWSSWRNWRKWQVDNVIAYDLESTQGLVKQGIQNSCNFFTRFAHYEAVGKPAKVNVYEGSFTDDFSQPEDIVAMHLANHHDLVLLLGFDVSQNTNYTEAFRETVKQYPNTQWVLIDHKQDLDPSLTELENLTCDKFQNVLALFRVQQ